MIWKVHEKAPGKSTKQMLKYIFDFSSHLAECYDFSCVWMSQQKQFHVCKTYKTRKLRNNQSSCFWKKWRKYGINLYSFICNYCSTRFLDLPSSLVIWCGVKWAHNKLYDYNTASTRNLSLTSLWELLNSFLVYSVWSSPY